MFFIFIILDCIDWGRNKKFIISRILERGNEEEKKEIAKYYGLQVSDLERFRSKNRYKYHKKP